MTIEQNDNFIASLGHDAYRVGGSVRDEIIGRRPKDADYMIRGVDLMELYGDLLRAVAGTAKITDLTLRDGQHVGFRIGRPYDIEITLPRREESTGPGHGDFKIVVDPEITLAEDAQRRDFTFNALYLPIGEAPRDLGYGLTATGGLDDPVVFDPTGRGLDDLRRRIINVTHPDSFRDDPLRILRALRFVARSYDLGPETHALMLLSSDAITGLTTPRETVTQRKMDGPDITVTRGGGMSGTVYQELCNILMGTEVRTALRVARDTGVLGTLFPELAPMLGFDQNSKYHDLTTDEHVFAALDNAARADASLKTRLALLFHDSGKPESAWVDLKGRTHFYEHVLKPGEYPRLPRPETSDSIYMEDHAVIGAFKWRGVADRMGVDKATREDVATLIENHMVPTRSHGIGVEARRMRVRFGDELMRDLLIHRMCDLLGKDGSGNKQWVEQIGTLEFWRLNAVENKIPTKVKELQINGHDVVNALDEAGADKGSHKMVGDILKAVLDEVVVRGDEQALTREWQLKTTARLAAVM